MSESLQPLLKRQIGLTLSASAAIGLLVGLFTASRSSDWMPIVDSTLGALAFGAVFALLNSLVLPRVQLGSRALTLTAQLAVASLAMAMVSFVIMNAILVLRYDTWMLARNQLGEFEARASWPTFALPILPVAVLAVLLFDQASRPMHALADRLARADKLASEARLQALRAQIDPHFLFNSLNSIAYLISTDPIRAEACVQRLANTFRYILSLEKRRFVTLEEELQIAEGYLDIERARFGNLLQVEFQVEEPARRWLLPPLTLQPLVENAVRHGVSKKVGGGRIIVRGQVETGELVLEVEDTGAGMTSTDANGSGLGLRNVSERLTHFFGSDYAPHIETTRGTGTSVHLRIPATQDSASAAIRLPPRDS